MDFTGSARCTCGQEMTGGGGQTGGPLSTTWRNCDCGIKAVFFSVQKGYEVKIGAEHEDALSNAAEEKGKLLAIFKIAEIKVEKYWNIKNEYHGNKSDWLLLKTDLGMIKIGWRKRVIAIDWSDTGIKMLISDDVTKNEDSCHAHSYIDAVEYMAQLNTYSKMGASQ